MRGRNEITLELIGSTSPIGSNEITLTFNRQLTADEVAFVRDLIRHGLSKRENQNE